MDRKSSSCSLALLDPELDNSDVFDPPAWRPGRYLQFADISLEDEPSVRPVSLSTRAVPGLTEVQHDCASPREQDSSSYLSLQMDTDRRMACRHSLLSRRTAVLLASCMTVAFTALTLLSVVL